MCEHVDRFGSLPASPTADQAEHQNHDTAATTARPQLSAEDPNHDTAATTRPQLSAEDPNHDTAATTRPQLSAEDPNHDTAATTRPQLSAEEVKKINNQVWQEVHALDEDEFNETIETCKKHSHFSKHVDDVIHFEGVDEDWVFGDPDGDAFEDVVYFITWLRIHGLPLRTTPASPKAPAESTVPEKQTCQPAASQHRPEDLNQPQLPAAEKTPEQETAQPVPGYLPPQPNTAAQATVPTEVPNDKLQQSATLQLESVQEPPLQTAPSKPHEPGSSPQQPASVKEALLEARTQVDTAGEAPNSQQLHTKHVEEPAQHPAPVEKALLEARPQVEAAAEAPNSEQLHAKHVEEPAQHPAPVEKALLEARPQVEAAVEAPNNKQPQTEPVGQPQQPGHMAVEAKAGALQVQQHQQQLQGTTQPTQLDEEASQNPGTAVIPASAKHMPQPELIPKPASDQHTPQIDVKEEDKDEDSLEHALAILMDEEAAEEPPLQEGHGSQTDQSKESKKEKKKDKKDKQEKSEKKEKKHKKDKDHDKHHRDHKHKGDGQHKKKEKKHKLEQSDHKQEKHNHAANDAPPKRRRATTAQEHQPADDNDASPVANPAVTKLLQNFQQDLAKLDLSQAEAQSAPPILDLANCVSLDDMAQKCQAIIEMDQAHAGTGHEPEPTADDKALPNAAKITTQMLVGELKSALAKAKPTASAAVEPATTPETVSAQAKASSSKPTAAAKSATKAAAKKAASAAAKREAKAAAKPKPKATPKPKPQATPKPKTSSRRGMKRPAAVPIPCIQKLLERSEEREQEMF